MNELPTWILVHAFPLRSLQIVEFFPIHWIAILLSCIVISVFSYWDFHLPYYPRKVRYAVSTRRYVLALTVYCGGYVFLFLMVLGISQNSIKYIMANPAVPLEGQLYGIRQISLAASILIVIILPYLPLTRRVILKFRHFAQIIMLYKQSIQLLTVLMAGTTFKLSQDIQDRIEREIELELRGYSVPRGALNLLLSPSAVRLLEETWSLRDEFRELSAVREFRGFLAARTETLKIVDLAVEKLFRRVAKALITASKAERNQLRVLSQFVAEDCQLAIAEYRTLLAEASMSCMPGPAARETFLKSFGYKVSLPPMLPYLPLVVSFGLDFVLLLWPLVLSPWVGLGLVPFPPTNIIAFSLAHALSQTAAIAWAVCPKAGYGLARPSLESLPYLSYLIFGFLSYITGVLVWLVLRTLVPPIPGMPLAEHPALVILTTSGSFLLMTVCMSVRIDLRLRQQTYEYKGGRLRDAVWLSLALTTMSIIIQFILLPLMPPPGFGWYLTAAYLGITFIVSFILGFFVPSVAAAYLQADEIIAKQRPNETEVLAQVKRRKLATLASQEPSSVGTS